MLKLEDSIRRIKQARPNLVIIEDDVQAFFEYKNSEADYSFTSLRKWFPCPDGAFISTKRTLNMETMVENKWSQYKFAGNILKKYNNVIDDSICLELLQKGEELLDVEYRSACSDISQVIFAHVDIETIAKKRMNNAAYLHSKLEKLGIRHAYRESAVPLFVPIFIENRTALRRRFFENNIFTPIHWPKVSTEINGDNELYMLELSLICDQRYDLEDMEGQIRILRQFLNGGEI